MILLYGKKKKRKKRKKKGTLKNQNGSISC